MKDGREGGKGKRKEKGIATQELVHKTRFGPFPLQYHNRLPKRIIIDDYSRRCCSLMIIYPSFWGWGGGSRIKVTRRIIWRESKGFPLGCQLLSLGR